jgi:hypothetical protein
MEPTPKPTDDCGFLCSTAFFILFGLACVFAFVCGIAVNGHCDGLLGIKKPPPPQQYQYYNQIYPARPV